MSTDISRRWYPILGAAILLAVMIAGCTGSPYGPQASPTQVAATPTPAATTLATTVMTTAPTPPMTTSTATQTTMPPTTVAITIQNFAFSPPTRTIPAGTTVIWTNQDSAPHQIVSDAQGFRSASLGKGQGYSFTFTTPGTYPYHCAIHPSMKGTITVT